MTGVRLQSPEFKNAGQVVFRFSSGDESFGYRGFVVGIPDETDFCGLIGPQPYRDGILCQC